MTAARKIPRDWRAGEKTKTTAVVIDSDKLPTLLTAKEAADFLRRHYKTVEEYRRDGSLRFIKIRGRFFTTPEFIAQFIESESNK